MTVRVLGIEGTAWAASAALYDAETGEVTMETAPFRPPSGGIDPSEAAEHMVRALPDVVGSALAGSDAPIDAVAFSHGPGLGPCLRLAATAGRTVAIRRDVPLLAVNHMVAHAEVGRLLGDVEDPIALNASGANAHVLGYRNGRYRVLGETMDTGVGNALDKFARHLGWSHPGGPRVERTARAGSYLELPYVVKGMDLSFSGIVSAAKEAVDTGASVPDVCCGLQETVFAMLVEVTERALALTHRDAVVLGGGVAHNERLREMLGEMVDARGGTLYVPPARFRGDNAGMIAITGARMLEAGETVAIEASAVDPAARPDGVAVTWRDEPPQRTPDGSSDRHGAEATIVPNDDGTLTKRRGSKAYRHPELDRLLRRRRTVREARLLHAARRRGVPTPPVLDIDLRDPSLVLRTVGTADLREALTPAAVGDLGGHLGRLHDHGLVHGDPTVRNVRVDDERTYLIDFGLGYHSDDVEDFAMDLHVFLQSLQDVTADRDGHRERLLAGYETDETAAVRDRLEAIEGRGRYR